MRLISDKYTSHGADTTSIHASKTSMRKTHDISYLVYSPNYDPYDGVSYYRKYPGRKSGNGGSLSYMKPWRYIP